MAVVTDDFNRANNISLGANWDHHGTYQIVSNQLAYRASSGICAAWTANTFPGDQYAQVKIVQRPSNDYAPGPMLKSDSVLAMKSLFGYNVSVRSDGLIRLQSDNTDVRNSATGAAVNGDTLRLECTTSGGVATLIVKVNGVKVTSGTFSTDYTDASPNTGGYLGLAAWAFWDGATDWIVDDFEGGDLNGGASVVITDAGDEAYDNGETSIPIVGTGFGTGGGSSAIIISPTDSIANGSAVTQTETGTRTATSATFTAVRGALPSATNLYLFVRDAAGVSNTAGRVVQFNAVPSISDASDESYIVGESITITGVDFGAAQGTGSVKLSPTDAVGNGAAVTQAITGWGSTSITITVAKGALSFLTPLYLFVTRDGGVSNTTGYVVQIEPRVFIRETLADLQANLAVNQTGLTALVWRSVPAGASTPDQVLSGLTTNASGVTAWQITRGALTPATPIWLAIFKDGSPAKATMRKITPSYE